MDISHQGIGLPRTGCDLHIYTPLFVCWPTATVLGSSLLQQPCPPSFCSLRCSPRSPPSSRSSTPSSSAPRLARHTPASALDTIVHELKSSTDNTEQLKAVGNERHKLTMQYRAKWDEDRAKLVHWACHTRRLSSRRSMA